MKALSGRQPWWWAILHAGKRIENRRWNTIYRGPILLHAAKGCTSDEHDEATAWMWSAGVLPRSTRPPDIQVLPRGGIVGRAVIIDVLRPLEAVKASRLEKVRGLDPRWWMPEQFGIVLAHVEVLPFTPFRGALSLFEVPDDYASRAP